MCMHRCSSQDHSYLEMEKMLRILQTFCFVGFFLVWNVNSQALQKCECNLTNTCYQSLSSDGSGQIDIRIVNSGAPSATLPPATTQKPPALVCKAGTQICCTGPGVTGCGIRWNIPLTPATTPKDGQARYGSQPWAVVILGVDNSTVGGGVLISPSNVLTVAHKVVNRTPASIRIRIGDWDANRDVEPYKPQDRTVTYMRIHPQFGPQNLTNDVAILHLNSPVTLGPNPSPVINTGCLPDENTPIDGLQCLVSGWGKDAFTGTLQSIIKEVQVSIVSNSKCQDLLRTNTRLGPTFILNPTSFICAGGQVGLDACVGDGGSGLMCNINGKYQVVGLVAWGIGCGTLDVPGVYVKVQNYLKWIKDNTIE